MAKGASAGESAGGSRFSYAQRLEICQQKESNLSMSQTALALWAKERFRLLKVPSQASISKILKKRDEYRAMTADELLAKRPRTVHFPNLEEALVMWVLQCLARNVLLSCQLIKAKGCAFAGMLGIPEGSIEFSNGWLQKFASRHKLRVVKLHGEAASVDASGAEIALPVLQAHIARYDRKDVYNMDETGLFYSMVPDRTLAQHSMPGHKKEKARITIALAANSDGSHKLPPFFIGHAKKPRCFKKLTGEQLGFFYRNNKKAWMTGQLFEEWLAKLNAEMASSNQKILLLMDNAPSHTEDAVASHVEICMLPPNTTARMQPMDAGIIAAFKLRYRRFHMQNAVDQDERNEVNLYKVDQLTGMQWCVAAWSDVSPATIKNCFEHTKLFDSIERASNVESEALPDVEDPIEVDSGRDALIADLRQALGLLRVRDPMSIEELIHPADEDGMTHLELEDEEIIDLVQPSQQDTGDCIEDMETESEISYSQSKKLRSLSVIISVLDISNPEDYLVHKRLRQLQQSLRFEDLHQGSLDLG